MVARGLTGVDGAVRIASTLVAKMRRWRKTEERTMVDTGGFGDEWEEPNGVRLRGSGSFEGIYAVDGATGQQMIEDALRANSIVILDLQHESGKVDQINARISQVEKGQDFEGASTFNAQYVQVGPPITDAGHA